LNIKKTQSLQNLPRLKGKINASKKLDMTHMMSQAMDSIQIKSRNHCQSKYHSW